MVRHCTLVGNYLHHIFIVSIALTSTLVKSVLSLLTGGSAAAQDCAGGDTWADIQNPIRPILPSPPLHFGKEGAARQITGGGRKFVVRTCMDPCLKIQYIRNVLWNSRIVKDIRVRVPTTHTSQIRIQQTHNQVFSLVSWASLIAQDQK